MRQPADARRGAARLLTALAVLLPAAASSSAQQEARAKAIGLVGEEVAVGFRGRLGGATLRRLQDEDGCTGQTSVGDAEAGIAQYSDPDACTREGPLVGCNGEWESVGGALLAAGCIAGFVCCCVAKSLLLWLGRFSTVTPRSQGRSISNKIHAIGIHTYRVSFSSFWRRSISAIPNQTHRNTTAAAVLRTTKTSASCVCSLDRQNIPFATTRKQ